MGRKIEGTCYTWGREERGLGRDREGEEGIDYLSCMKRSSDSIHIIYMFTHIHS